MRADVLAVLALAGVAKRMSEPCNMPTGLVKITFSEANFKAAAECRSACWFLHIATFFVTVFCHTTEKPMRRPIPIGATYHPSSSVIVTVSYAYEFSSPACLQTAFFALTPLTLLTQAIASQ